MKTSGQPRRQPALEAGCSASGLGVSDRYATCTRGHAHQHRAFGAGMAAPFPQGSGFPCTCGPQAGALRNERPINLKKPLQPETEHLPARRVNNQEAACTRMHTRAHALLFPVTCHCGNSKLPSEARGAGGGRGPSACKDGAVLPSRLWLSRTHTVQLRRALHRPHAWPGNCRAG